MYLYFLSVSFGFAAYLSLSTAFPPPMVNPEIYWPNPNWPHYNNAFNRWDQEPYDNPRPQHPKPHNYRKKVVIKGRETRTVDEGTVDYKLTCKTHYGRSRKLGWSMYGESELPEGTHESNGVLTFSKVTQDHEGCYACHDLLQDERPDNVCLKVESAKEIQRKKPHVIEKYVVEGGSIEVDCRLEGDKDHSFTWTGPERHLPVGSDTKNDGKTLILNNIRQEHSGLYICQKIDNATKNGVEFDIIKVIVAPLVN